MFEHALMTSDSQSLREPLADLRVLEGLNHVVHVDAGVPDIQNRHFAEFRHALPIRANTGEYGVASEAIAKAVMTASQDEAGGQALYVPLPGSRKRFVQVVNVEDFASLRRGEHAEIEQMGVAAGL